MRPFTVTPRGPRRQKRVHARWLIALPRQSPQWELAALEALMKPKAHTKATIQHTNSKQTIPRDLVDRVCAVCDQLASQLTIELEPHFPTAGDFAFALATPGDRWGESLAITRALSRHLPGVWLTVGRVFVRDGVFFNRERRFGLKLRRSSHHHVPREIAARLAR